MHFQYNLNRLLPLVQTKDMFWTEPQVHQHTTDTANDIGCVVLGSSIWTA